MKNARISPPLGWQLGFSAVRDAVPGRWIPASVPGAVQLDWARAEGWPSHTVGKNSEAYRWMEDVWWTYRTVLQVPVPEPGGAVRFVATGVDYRCELFVDGRLTTEHEGIYSPVTADLTAFGGGEVEIRIRIAPVPKSNLRADDRVQADHAFKPAVSYGWDFHPRLVPLGLCDEAELRVLPALRLEEVGVVGGAARRPLGRAPWPGGAPGGRARRPDALGGARAGRLGRLRRGGAGGIGPDNPVGVRQPPGALVAPRPWCAAAVHPRGQTRGRGRPLNL